MKTKFVGFRMALAIALSGMAQEIHALTLSKDTVYETTFLGWNDSVSLLNRSSDTVIINAIGYSVPAGKYAEIGLRYGEPYLKYGVVDGPIIHAGRTYTASTLEESTIPPHGRVLISGFDMEICLECPLAKTASADGDRDTLVTYLIFDTKVKLDTLVVIGVVWKETSGIRIPFRPRGVKKSGRETRYFHFFNILGQPRFLKNPDPG